MGSLRREQVRAIDGYAIETLGIPGVVLMENAGRNAAESVAARWKGHFAGRSVAVVCGAGNNGGDGFVIARHLGNWGARVAVFLVADPGKISGDAEANLRPLHKLGRDVQDWTGRVDQLGEELAQYDLIVDAVGGTGICGPLRGEIAIVVQQINAAERLVLAVDIPTGLDCDTGAADGPTVQADWTVTFLARKLGFDNPASHAYTGDVQVADIGINPDDILPHL